MHRALRPDLATSDEVPVLFGRCSTKLDNPRPSIASRPSTSRVFLLFAQGNRTQVARLLGVSYPTVAKKIADYGLGKDKNG